MVLKAPEGVLLPVVRLGSFQTGTLGLSWNGTRWQVDEKINEFKDKVEMKARDVEDF